MLLFSTKLKVNDKLTADAFVQLIIELNNTSKYEEKEAMSRINPLQYLHEREVK